MRPKIDTPRTNLVTASAAGALQSTGIKSATIWNRLTLEKSRLRLAALARSVLIPWPARGNVMSAAHSIPASTPRCTTLLELVVAVSESTTDEREIVATVLHMLRTQRVRLCGNFAGCNVDDLS
jgi:hypothetical protein